MEENKDIEMETSQENMTQETATEVAAEEQTTESAEVSEEAQEEASEKNELEQLRQRVSELEDLRLRQIAEFDNYRRRTNKEKLELLETAGERIFKDMLPLIDDFERAAQHGDLSEGGQLIYKKFTDFLEANKVTAIPTDGEFDTDIHEAITTFNAGPELKGKIIDCTQRGYKLGEKVIRFAKVVVGE